jgi:glycerate dehydrogenase
MSMKIVVLDGYALNPGDLTWDSLRQLGTVEIHDRTPEDLVVQRSQGAEVLLTNKTALSRATVSQLPALKYIGVLATGYNIVDTAAARERGIVVTNIPTYGTASVAQFAIALLLELCHHVGFHGEAVRSGEWSRNPDWSFWKTPLIELSGRTMGIIGFGRIGRQTGAIAAALGMRVVANDAAEVNPPDYPQFEWMTLDRIVSESDVLSLHCPLFPENRGMINKERLSVMKRSAFLLNTSRGPLVVDQDLADALNEDVIAGAGLDVLSVEPPVASNPLLSAKNCIVTPHIAWATREARARLLDVAVENLRAFVDGRVVNAV